VEIGLVAEQGHSSDVTPQVFGAPLVLLLVSYAGGDGAVEQFDYVEDFLVGVVNLDAGAKLKEATGVGGDDDFGAGRGGLMHFVG
jgi:hypothetical protein